MDEQNEGADLIALDATEGRWFPWLGGTEFKVRRIPRAKLRELEVQSYGKEFAFQRDGGTRIDRRKVEEYTRRKATYALVDSRGGVRIPRELMAGTTLEKGDGDRATVDGHWTDEVKDRVFRETGLAAVIVKWADELSEIADAEVSAVEEEKD